MKTLTASLVAFVFMFLTTLAVIGEGNWVSGYLYFIAVLSALIALLTGNSKTTGVIAALGTVVSGMIYIALIDGTVGLEQGTILAGIIGIPGGYIPVLAITLLIMFIISFLGYLVGSSFDMRYSRSAEETE